MSARRTAIFLTLVVLGVTASVLSYATAAGSVGYLLGYAVVVGLAWRSAVRRRRPDRGPGILIAAAITLWMTGDLIEAVQYYFFTVPPVGPSDVCWLGGYPLLAVALIQMARRRAPGQLRGAVLDGATLTMAGAMLSWQFLISPLLGSGESLATSVVPALYPVADVVLLAGVLIIALSPGGRGRPTQFLLGGVTVYLAVDLGYNLLPYVVSYDLVARLGPLVLAGNGLLVAALLHPAGAELLRPGARLRTLHAARVLFLGCALMTAPTLAILRSDPGGTEAAALAATAACAAFILARFTTAVREQERSQAQLAYQAHHDPLTGLANRTVLHDRLGETGEPVAVLYLDLDGFKEVNDRLGHEAGDAVLQAVATRLSAAVRQTDLVSRLGGDEFVLLCPGATEADAIELAERVLSDVAEPVPYRGELLHVGVSIGIASRSDAADSAPVALLRSADSAMYDAKRLGRGHWVLAAA
ncbi:GGDEF domain-containing protein [Cryptosporangium arvum]|uniref:Diguanylate cyclase (GGDEF) domain-containing protein n=1 Tax=Cryptosporangium arvum DSM 44712 TaxID=927661 RepID=A0A010ZVJ5_9ACTN|nr:GGDEF domain-containing protein [Cryptosporangium arvum]EXG82714.1 diguanylate cyclase (GGDEF) domain-containing protein [Cryptosporangium arvum DSM 44712]